MYLERVIVKKNMDFNLLRREILAGLTVSFAIIPEAIAFSIVAGLSPLVGLYTAFTVGLVTAVFGGKPGMISGATGAIAVGLAPLVKEYGVEYIFATALLAGVLQIFLGFLRVERFMKFVSPTVTVGFLNGIAIIIFMAQLAQFKTGNGAVTQWMTGQPFYMMLFLVLGTLMIIGVAPRLIPKIPGALVGLAAIFLAVYFFELPARTVGDISPIGGDFPPFHLAAVPMTLETLRIIFPFSLIMAGVGLIESLLTVKIISDAHKEKGDGHREIFAQGGANIISGLFGGMGGCAMIGQSLINNNAGGRRRLSGMVAAMMLLVFIMFAAPLIEMIPLAALTGIMIMIAVKTFNWQHFREIKKMPLNEFLNGITVMAITVFTHNLALAVLTGVVISALTYTWANSNDFSLGYFVDVKGVKHYSMRGSVFYASIASLEESFTVDSDPVSTVLHIPGTGGGDSAAKAFLENLSQRYSDAGKELQIIIGDGSYPELNTKH